MKLTKKKKRTINKKRTLYIKRIKLIIVVSTIIGILVSAIYKEKSFVAEYQKAKGYNVQTIKHQGEIYYKMKGCENNVIAKSRLGRIRVEGFPLKYLNNFISDQLVTNRVGLIKYDDSKNFIEISGVGGIIAVYCKKEVLETIYPGRVPNNLNKKIKWATGNVTGIVLQGNVEGVLTDHEDISFLQSLNRLDSENITFSEQEVENKFYLDFCYNNLPLFTEGARIVTINNQYIYIPDELISHNNGDVTYLGYVIIDEKRLEEIYVDGKQVFHK